MFCTFESDKIAAKEADYFEFSPIAWGYRSRQGLYPGFHQPTGLFVRSMDNC